MPRASPAILLLLAACGTAPPEAPAAPSPIETSTTPTAEAGAAPPPPAPAPATSAAAQLPGEGGWGRGLCIRLAGAPSGPACMSPLDCDGGFVVVPAPVVVHVERVERFGAVGASAIEAAYQDERAAFYSCYREALAGEPALRGSLRARLSVGEGGCGSVQVLRSSLPGKRARECLVALLETLPLPAPPVRGSVTLTVTFDGLGDAGGPR